MDYVVCVPSYRRARLCNDLTLALLSTHGIDPARIYVYVADEAERETYAATLDRGRYNALVVAVPGIVAVREFIVDAWPEGTRIVSVDDDIRNVIFRTDRYANLHAFIPEAFAECARCGSFIWGVHPVGTNALFMRGAEMSTDARYIVGCLYGFVNRPHLPAIRWDVARSFNGAKEDVELSLLYYIHDGVVLRFNRVGVVTRYFRASGGQGGVDGRRAAHEGAARQLAAQYPHLGFLRLKANRILDFVIRKRP
jgi:hypothetical protein